MKLPHRRHFLHLAASAAVLPAVSRFAWAQAYPSRPVRIVVGFPPGGSNDIHARLIAQRLSERLGQQFIVENRGGAGGSLATETVARSAPDGYTLLLSSATDSWNAALYPNLKFDFIRDIAPVASIAIGMGVLVVNPSFPARSVPELIAAARSHPGKITVASAGVGSAPHLFWELFRSLTKVDMLHVPYRGGGPAVTDLLAGQVQLYFSTMAASIEYIRADKLRALAVTAATRWEGLPNIPTVAEFVPNYDATAWWGIGAPKNTPVEIIQKLNTEINAGLADPKLKERFADLGSTVFVNSPAGFGKFTVDFTEKWDGVIRAANIKAE
jgi:tripartite-type tricarboxylate transporter receptor subunit TctC